jgi:hypothetical protein
LSIVIVVLSLALALARPSYRCAAAEGVRPFSALQRNARQARDADGAVVVPPPAQLAQEESVDGVRFALSAQERAAAGVFGLAARALHARAEGVDEQHAVAAAAAQHVAEALALVRLHERAVLALRPVVARRSR